MNCVLFAKMDQVFSKENQTLKKYWKIGEKYWKSQGKVREFCQSGKVGTLTVHLGVHMHLHCSHQVHAQSSVHRCVCFCLSIHNFLQLVGQLP